MSKYTSDGSIYGKHSANVNVSKSAQKFSETKKKLLKEFYAGLSESQGKNPEDWFNCSICDGVVHLVYKDKHAAIHTATGEAFPKFSKITNFNPKTIDSGNDVLTVEESLDKLTKACEGCTGDEACCAIVGLKSAGWDVDINPAIAYGDRKGFQITILEPKKEG